jgi:ABC-2 type transport system permease protein
MLTFQSQGHAFNGYRGGEVEDHHLMPGTSSHSAQSRFFKAVPEPWEIFAEPEKFRWLRRDADGVVTLHGRWIVPRHWATSPSPAEETTDELLETLLAEKPVSEDVEGIRIRVENPQAETQENPRIAMYAAGIAVLFLLFSATGNAAALLEEAESGTLDRILVSKAGLFPIVSGKWLGILVLGCLQITVMFVWAELMFRIQLGQHIAGFCVMTFSTAAATASFAMLLATLCKSRAQLNAVSVVIILSMSAVGGSMIPRFAMSDRMKEIGQWTFNAWALDGYQKVFWYQTPVTSLFKEVSVLLGSALVLGILTLMLSGRWKRA